MRNAFWAGGPFFYCDFLYFYLHFSPRALPMEVGVWRMLCVPCVRMWSRCVLVLVGMPQQGKYACFVRACVLCGMFKC
jgi:hypothetical protein